MQIKIYTVPISDIDSAQMELNNFLLGIKILEKNYFLKRI
jgi:hypothetical protein